MQEIIDILKTDNFLLVTAIVLIVLSVLFIILCIYLIKINKRYKKFLTKLGNGERIEDDLENFMHIVGRVEKQNLDIISNIKTIEKDITKCIKKVGVVRYNAFQDTGSDLSFAIALLDDSNDGMVLNGIYSRDNSNIYAKPVKNGESTYILSEEEKQAIKQAVDNAGIYRLNK